MEVYDIETLKRMFLYMSKEVETGLWRDFEISEWRNDLDSLIKHLVGNKNSFISFNGLGFDAQVLQYIIDNYTRWWNLGNVEIVSLIYKFAQKIIDDQKYDLFPPYREEEFENSQIDLFKIHHFDNENKRTSLKWLEFTMDSPNVEEMPIHHAINHLSMEDRNVIKEYCKNDIFNTYRFYQYTIGEVEHEDYKGSNMIQDRLDLIEELGLPTKAVNYNNVKMGEEIIKQAYCKLANKKPWELYDLKAARKPTPHFTFGDCIPSYVTFKNPTFQAFYEKMKGTRVNLNNEKVVYPFSYNGTNYTIAQGGIHSTEKNRIVIVKEGWRCTEADIGGQYPHSIIKRELSPSHLGKLWLAGCTWVRDRRAGYKKKAKTSRKFKGLTFLFKYAQNGGSFGKTNDKKNWQYDPFVQFSCTIGNQFEILMLIEWLEEAGIHVISANTDGVVCLFERSMDPKYYEICDRWEKLVGNDVQGKLEFTEYSKLIQGSVNDYLAVGTDGKIKKKGDFATSFELHKNPSRRVVNIAIEKYFTEGVPVQQTIMTHNRIYDFCIGVKASKDYHYEILNKIGEVDMYNRLVRYYVSSDGERLWKVKNEGSEGEGVQRSQCEAGLWKCTVANRIIEGTQITKYNINYAYYIEKAQERIDALERGGKRKVKLDPNQQNLF